MSDVIFSKYSNDRDDKFNIVTEVVRDENGTKKVRKYPYTSAAKEHVERMVESSRILRKKYEDTLVQCARIEKYENGVEIEWIEGKSFDVYLDNLLLQGEMGKWKLVVNEYFENMFLKKRSEFTITDAFRSVFGEINLENNMQAVENVDVDLLFSNVIYEKQKWIMYDCEWFVEFPVPIKFLVYRCLHYYLNSKNGLTKNAEDIYKEFGIGQNECDIFARMENNFQKFVEGKNIPMWRLYQKIHGEIENVCALHNRVIQEKLGQVFYDFGRGFSEQDSKKIVIPKNEKGYCEVCIPLPKNTVAVRFDPASIACLVTINGIRDKDGRELDYTTNGYMVEEDICLFLHNDPQILIAEKNLTERIWIEYDFHSINDKHINVVSKIKGLLTELSDNNNRLESELQINEHEIIELESCLKKKESELADLKTHYFAAINQREELKAQLQFVNQAYNDIVNSECWKLTKPLRFVLREIKRIIFSDST